MKSIPEPIFKRNLSKISWEKIYEREYGVQYSELAVLLLAYAKHHFPKTSLAQVVVPGSENNTIFYIDSTSWIQLVEGLNKKYTANVKNLEAYEKQFLFDGNAYLQTAKYIANLDLKTISDTKLISVFKDYNNKRYNYSVFAWSAFILNNYVADRATKILDKYIKKHKLENEKQQIYDSLFTPHKRAAILELQYLVEQHKNTEDLYERFKWLSCLDIHNKPWTKEAFKKQIEPFAKPSNKKISTFDKYIKQFVFEKKDLECLLMAKRFVYIKDARDDIRRESVFYAKNLFEEIAKRIKITPADTSYLQEKEIVDFFSKGKEIDVSAVLERKKGFCVYLDAKKQLVCLSGDQVKTALSLFKLLPQEEKQIAITGRVASGGKAKGIVFIVRGAKDLPKVKVGSILVAVTTHPDYVSAMRKAVAIITDEGSITSHAAIVAREFGIPCVVGCKNATKLLKDGDVVEVDAAEGKVIKLS